MIYSAMDVKVLTLVSFIVFHIKITSFITMEATKYKIYGNHMSGAIRRSSQYTANKTLYGRMSRFPEKRYKNKNKKLFHRSVVN